MPLLMIVTLIAMAAHEANRAYCLALGDLTQLLWDDAPDWQKDSAIAGVNMHLANPDATPEDSHASWLAEKVAAGWVYGPAKDAEKKEHPCCVPYAELPEAQKAKDYIFRGVVHATKRALDEVIATATSGVAGLEAALLKATEKACGVEGGASGRSMTAISGTAVKYIGRRPHWDDGIYSTGLSFAAGQVRVLPTEIARKLLRHCDLFEQADQSAVAQDNTDDLLNAGKKLGAKRDESDVEFAVIDQVNRMDDRDVLVEFAQNRFNLKLAKTKKPETMRAEIIAHINRFGVV